MGTPHSQEAGGWWVLLTPWKPEGPALRLSGGLHLPLPPALRHIAVHAVDRALRPLCERFLGEGGGPWQRQPTCPVFRRRAGGPKPRGPSLALPPQIPRSYLSLQEAVLAEQQRRSLSDDVQYLTDRQLEQLVDQMPCSDIQDYEDLQSGGQQQGRAGRADHKGSSGCQQAQPWVGSWGGAPRLFTAPRMFSNDSKDFSYRFGVANPY